MSLRNGPSHMIFKLIFLVTIFPKNVGERGGGGGSRGGEKLFPDFQKKGRKNFSGHKPIKFRVKSFLRADSC